LIVCFPFVFTNFNLYVLAAAKRRMGVALKTARAMLAIKVGKTATPAPLEYLLSKVFDFAYFYSGRCSKLQGLHTLKGFLKGVGIS
jgi:hypothetical protein